MVARVSSVIWDYTNISNIIIILYIYIYVWYPLWNTQVFVQNSVAYMVPPLNSGVRSIIDIFAVKNACEMQLSASKNILNNSTRF